MSALLQKKFSITVDIENLCGSEVIAKKNLRDLDKKGSLYISFDPVLLCLLSRSTLAYSGTVELFFDKIAQNNPVRLTEAWRELYIYNFQVDDL